MAVTPVPPTPLTKAVVYDPLDVLSLPLGATACQYGDILKFSSNLLVPAAQHDKQIQFFVALENAPAYGDLGTVSVEGRTVTCVELIDVGRIEMAYNTAPLVGSSYALNDARTIDQSDTSDPVLTVVSLDSSRATADCIAYLKTS